MGVLAIIAFNAFSGVVNNVKKRADDQNAKLIEKAITAYVIDSGDTSLANLYYKTRDGANYTKYNLTDNTAGVNGLITALMCNIRDKADDTYKNEYGPYLSPEDGASESADQFALQWSASNNTGDYAGFEITIYRKDKTVRVRPTTVSGNVGIDLVQ